MNIYQENGFETRNEYLKHLSNEYDVNLDIVWNLASILGDAEDFDGLLNALEDTDELIF